MMFSHNYNVKIVTNNKNLDTLVSSKIKTINDNFELSLSKT